MVKVRDWLSAHDVLQTARFKDDGKPMGVRTRLVVSDVSPSKHGSDDTVYAVKYCWTEVVRYYPNGIISVNMEGHDSKTTKARVRDHAGGTYVCGDRGDELLLPFGYTTHFVPVNFCKEYFIDRKNRMMYGPQGEAYDKRVVKVVKPKPVPKYRDPVKSMFKGDVLTDPFGDDWMVFVSREREKVMVRYFGDDPNNTAFCHLGENEVQVNDMFLLSMGDRWKAKARYIRQFEIVDMGIKVKS